MFDSRINVWRHNHKALRVAEGACGDLGWALCRADQLGMVHRRMSSPAEAGGGGLMQPGASGGASGEFGHMQPHHYSQGALLALLNPLSAVAACSSPVARRLVLRGR